MYNPGSIDSQEYDLQERVRQALNSNLWSLAKSQNYRLRAHRFNGDIVVQNPIYCSLSKKCEIPTRQVAGTLFFQEILVKHRNV